MRFLLLLALVVPFNLAKATKGFGDEDPFPLTCLDFSGSWKTDDGVGVFIEQGKQCNWLKVRGFLSPRDSAVTIVPDDRVRLISGSTWRGDVRYRWNNKSNATIIETRRNLSFSDSKTSITELILLEKVNDNLLLESIYRTVRDITGKNPNRKEYDQRVYRREEANSPRQRIIQ